MGYSCTIEQEQDEVDEMSSADRDYWDMQDSSICDDYEDSSVGVEYKGQGFF